MLITGYTLEQNMGDETAEDAAAHWRREQRCEFVLPTLAMLVGPLFDVVLIDGNHEGSYLRRELTEVRKLLRPGGLVVMDDVFEGITWRDVRAAFDDAAEEHGLEEVARSSRGPPTRRELVPAARWGRSAKTG